jgi:hypothetical protein
MKTQTGTIRRLPDETTHAPVGGKHKLVNREHLGGCCRLDHKVMTIRDMFFTRPPPPPVLSAVQRLDWFLNSIREKNSLVVTGKLEEFDEPHRSEKPL